MITNFKTKALRDCALLGVAVALTMAALFNDLLNPSYGSYLTLSSAGRLSEIDLAQETFPPYIGAVNGWAFVLKQKELGIEVIPFKTTLPVFKAFGLSKDQKTLLYIPLKNAIPSGELYVENLTTGSARKITSQLVMEAAWSPTDVDKIAYTFSVGHGFGLAMVDVKTGECKTLVSNQVLADMLQWKDSGDGVYYVEAVAEPLYTRLSIRFFSIRSWASEQVAPPSRPNSVPSLKENVPSGQIAGTAPEIVYSFECLSPDGLHEVSGSSFLGSGPLYARKNPSSAQAPLGDRKLVKVLNKGVVVRNFAGAVSTLEFIDWSGQSTNLGASVAVNYNLPLRNPKVTQGGVLYPPPGNCNIVSHGPGFGYAYDLASTTIGEHVLASADGLVVHAISTVTCNTIDTACPDYDPNGCPGTFLGNQVVIQHSDESYTGYAHMEKYSVQVPVGAAVCQGSYIGRQGHTGSTRGSVVACGDHLHFQRQSSPDMLGGTLSISFSDVASNPLSCGTTYTSGSAEFSNSISPVSQSFADLGGSGSVNVTSPSGCSWLATSNDGWITITSPGTGTGNDVVTYTVAENTSGMPRAGTMIIAGQTFTITQDGGGVTNQAPVVNAGADQTIIIPSSATLTSTVTDDGLPNPPGTLTISWIQVSGPGTVSFANSSTANTTATFSLTGVYVLRLTASDLGASTSDDVTITVIANQGPAVTLTAPADGSSFTPPATITVSAIATDSDGSISKVDFFANGVLVGTDTTDPYSIDWANAQPGNYSLKAMATDNLGASTDSSNPVVITVINGGGGTLSSNGVTPPSAVNLSNEGSLDWAHWGLTSATSFNHKSGVTQQISNFTKIGNGSVGRVNSNSVAFSWTGGTPTASATNTPSGVWRSGIGNGFQITAPADTTDKTLKLYVGLWKAQGRLEVSLSDSSAPVYVDTSLDNSTSNSVRVYTISYRAASSGQQLKVKWTLLTSYDPFGNITLQAATLVLGGGGDTNQAPVVNAGSDQTITLPASATLTGTVTDDGLPNPPGVFTTTWSQISGPGTASFTNPNAVSTAASFSTAGVYVLQLTADDSALAGSDTVTITAGDGSGLLSVSGVTPPSAVNLSNEGILDWAHWGLTSATSFNHKSGVTQQISNYTKIGSGGVSRVNANPVAYSWTGGVPTPSATNTPSGIWKSGISTGFEITIPADTTDKTLKLYVGLWQATGKLEATLSDGSAPAQIDTSLSDSSSGSVGVFTINYRAGSAGQQLKLRWTMLSGTGNITFQAATLINGGGGANQAPVVNAGTDQTITLPASANLDGTVTDDGLPSPPGAITTNWTMVSGPGVVTFGDANAVDTTASFSAPGTYVLRLTGNDSALSNSDDLTATVSPEGGAGSLSVSGATPPATVNLTSEGVVDWAHWGLTSATSFNHKSGVTQQISNYTKIGSAAVKRVNANPVAYSWTDGVPTPSATNTPSGIWKSGINTGFEITIPADTTDKTVKLYVGLWQATGKLEATLSDGSAPAHVDTSLSNSTGTSVGVFTINYRAGSAGQQLKLRWTMLSGTGNITFQAATRVN